MQAFKEAAQRAFLIEYILRLQFFHVKNFLQNFPLYTTCYQANKTEL